MSELLSEKNKAFIIVSDAFNKYFVQASKYVLVFNSDAMTLVGSLIDIIKKHIGKLHKNIPIFITGLKDLDECYFITFKIFSSVKTIDTSLSKVHDLLSTTIRIHEDSNISTTSSIETLDMLNMILRVYTEYKIKSAELDIGILNHLANILFSIAKSAKGEPYKIAQDQYRLSDNTVELYSVYVRLLLDFYYGSKDIRRYFLVKQLENDKTWQLLQYDVNGWDDIRFKDIPKIKVCNPFTSEWGLIPQTLLNPLTQTFQHLFAMDSLSELSDIQKSIDHISKIRKITIRLIVINKIMPRAIQYDTSRILGHQSQEYKIPEHAGVDLKAIKKFNILNVSVTDAWDFSVELYEKINDSYIEEITNDLPPTKSYYIIETLDRTNFRILAPYKSKDRYLINGSYILKLLRCVEKTKTPSRITEYNKELELAMYENMLSTSKLPLHDIGLKSSYTIDIGMVRQRIQDCLLDVYDKHVKVGMKELSTLREIIFSNKLVQQFINAQISIYFADESYFKLIADPTLCRKTFNQNDILVTFLLHVNKAIRGFQREMNDNFHEITSKINDYELKHWSFDKRRVQFRSIFEKIVEVTIKHIFTTDNNSYRYVRFKVDILNMI